jgi:phage shock protein C
MYCTKCGQKFEVNDRFCAKCGAPTSPEYGPQRARARFSRPVAQKSIAGVCAGFARYFDVDVSLMRILWLAMAVLSGGLGVLIYLAAWMIMPADAPLESPA